MTTLPQTTPLRLPRPASSAPLAVPGQMMASPGSYAPATPVVGMTGADVWRVIRSNLWLIILLGALGAAAGYAINSWFLRYHPKYTSEGKLIVLSTEEGNDMYGRAAIDAADLMLEVRTHAAMLHDPKLFSNVLQDPNSETHSTAWYNRFSNPDDAKRDLNDGDKFSVQFTADSKLITLSMTDSDPRSCQTIVQEVGNEYVKEQEDRSQARQYARHRELAGEEVTLEGKLHLVNVEISELQAELNTAGVSGTMNNIDTKDMEMRGILDKLFDKNFDLQTAQTRLDRLKSKINSGGDDPIEVTATISGDSGVQEYSRQVTGLQGELDDLTAQFGPENQQLIKVQTAYMRAKKQLDDQRERIRSSMREELLEAATDTYNGLKTEVDAMNKKMETLKSEMAQLTDKMTSLLEKKTEKDSLEAKLKIIQDQKDQLENLQVKHGTAGVEWASEPTIPDVPSFPKLGTMMPLAIITSLLLALGIAFLREFMDTSIRSPRDISRIGNMNLLGMVPHEDDDPQSAGARLPVVIFEAPHSMMAEQLRQVRTRLQHGSSLDTTRSILVTSPSPGDGKSTIACNLASGLALNGRRILLVDANFRRPELHRIFNIGNEKGFSDVLNSLDLFESAIQETQVPNLSVLPSGPKPSNATELIESQLLTDFVERALEEFDHVIFDSGPLLFVSETVALAPRVDGVVSIVRARTNTRGVLTRMRDMLRQVKAEHLGVVLNGVRAQGGGYYGRNIRTFYEYQSGKDNGRAA